MPGLKDILRRQLAQRGYVINKLEPGLAPSLASCLQSLRAGSTTPFSVICFDQEIRIQSELLAVFTREQVVFTSPILDETGKPAPGTVLPPEPAGPFAVVLDLSFFPLAPLFAQLPWLTKATTLLLRPRFGSFWSEELDLTRLAADLAARDFHLADAIDFTCVPPLPAPTERPTFVCKRGATADLPRAQRYRVNEALTALSVPLARRAASRLLAGRGSYGFPAGVLNPGALADGDRTLLLCRTEKLPWAVMKTAETQFFRQSPPLLLELDSANRIASATEFALHGLPDADRSRAEDFRLFRFRGEVYSNHAVISNPTLPGTTPPRLEVMQTRLALSRIDYAGRRLEWRGLPTLDRPLTRVEKNWAMFADGDRLFLLYSFSPYILLEAKAWPGLEFATVARATVAPPFGGDGLALRNSLNPVAYDDRHWLHVVHKVYPNKQYCYFAVLIDRTTLRPVRASARPLASGWGSGAAAIHYACSAVVRPAEVLLFAGVDDCGTAVTAIPRARLDAEWMPLACTDTP